MFCFFPGDLWLQIGPHLSQKLDLANKQRTRLWRAEGLPSSNSGSFLCFPSVPFPCLSFFGALGIEPRALHIEASALLLSYMPCPIAEYLSINILSENIHTDKHTDHKYIWNELPPSEHVCTTAGWSRK